MATTTNYNWATPDDTDLVKDGASAIRTLGSSADTTVKNLNPGTTAGDIDYYTSGTAKARIAIGTANQVLQVNSGATAPEWGVDPVADVITTAGDLIYGTAADTVARLGIGTAGQVLQVNSGATAPEWATPAAGGATFVGVKCVSTSGSISIANNTIQIVNWNSENFDTDAFHSTATNTSRITIPAGKDGKYQIIAQLHYIGNATGQRQIRLKKNGVFTNNVIASVTGTSDEVFNIVEIFDLVATDYIEVAAYQNSGGALNISVSNTESFFSANYLGA